MSLKITVEITENGAIRRIIDFPQGATPEECQTLWDNYTGANKTTDDLMKEFVKVRPDHFRKDDPRSKQYATQIP